MSDKIKLLELANKKITANKEFVAYFLDQYLAIEGTTVEALMEILKCDIESYYKLGLCKIPAVDDKNYLVQLNNVSTYTGISSLELNKIIKRVSAVVELRSNDNSYLMAARDKKKKDNDQDNSE